MSTTTNETKPLASAPIDVDRSEELEVTILMPCLNEAETIGICVEKAMQAIRDAGVSGEVVVADNGSTDGSQEIATRLGARVVPVRDRGYGSALRGGIADARGRYVLMGDADDSYNFLDLPVFLAKLREGYQLVMGNRFRGGIAPGAMPPLHKYLGNPVLTFIGKLFFKSESSDFHCGLRAFDRRSIEALKLRTTGMEFASEMVVKASLHRLKVAEVPTTLKPDGRSRPPHLRSWRDGWRHLRFLLMYSPRWLFLLPGFLLALLGLGVGAWLMPGPGQLGGLTLDVHTLLFASLAIMLGAQAVFFAVFTKVFALTEGLLPADPRIDRLFDVFNLERGLIMGALLTVAGVAGSIAAVWIWRDADFGDLDPATVLRIAIPSTTAIALGVQLIFGSFFLSILGLRRH